MVAINEADTLKILMQIVEHNGEMRSSLASLTVNVKDYHDSTSSRLLQLESRQGKTEALDSVQRHDLDDLKQKERKHDKDYTKLNDSVMVIRLQQAKWSVGASVLSVLATLALTQWLLPLVAR